MSTIWMIFLSIIILVIILITMNNSLCNTVFFLVLYGWNECMHIFVLWLDVEGGTAWLVRTWSQSVPAVKISRNLRQHDISTSERVPETQSQWQLSVCSVPLSGEVVSTSHSKSATVMWLEFWQRKNNCSAVNRTFLD